MKTKGKTITVENMEPTDEDKDNPSIQKNVVESPGNVLNAQASVIFAEQDHSFKHSGEEVTQCTLTEDSAETVEVQDHNYSHAAIYCPTSSTDDRPICV